MRPTWKRFVAGLLGVAAVSCGPAAPPSGPLPAGSAKAAATATSASGAVRPGGAGASGPVLGEAVDPQATPVFGRLAKIGVLGGDQAVSIDEAGAVRVSGSPLFTGERLDVVGLPFSQPVEEVVFVRQVSAAVAPGALAGKVFCARTRAGGLECLTDHVKTELDGRRVRVAALRFALPGAGRVTHVGTAPPPSDPVVCARYEAQGGPPSEAASCWQFSHDGKQAAPYAMEQAAAAAIATRVSPALEDAWRRAEPEFDARRARKVVATEAADPSRVLGAQAGGSIAVSCAILESGVLSCFGPGVYGELGDGALQAKARASRPLGAASVVDVAMHGRYACAVAADGRVSCWGKLPETLPLARREPKVALPMCALDRAASLAQLAGARQRAADEARACSEGCKANPHRDCMLRCEERCTPVPYVFRHDTLCQEPLGLEQAVAQQFGTSCIPAQQQARWLSDGDLRDMTPAVGLTLAPVEVQGVTDAVSVAVWGPRVCVVRREGSLQCFEP